jgi:Fe-S cluster assembly iron-binding protein IscA
VIEVTDQALKQLKDILAKYKEDEQLYVRIDVDCG